MRTNAIELGEAVDLGNPLGWRAIACYRDVDLTIVARHGVVTIGDLGRNHNAGVLTEFSNRVHDRRTALGALLSVIPGQGEADEGNEDCC